MKLTRRQGALARLEKQLKSGVKPSKETGKPDTKNLIPLSEHDRERITKQIDVLKSRV